MVPPVEDPNFVTQMNLGLVPALQLGQDELGSTAVYQRMSAVASDIESCVVSSGGRSNRWMILVLTHILPPDART